MEAAVEVEAVVLLGVVVDMLVSVLVLAPAAAVAERSLSRDCIAVSS